MLEPNQIGLILPIGYRRNGKQSGKALKWLAWESRERGIDIRTKQSGTEYKIGPYYVDGYHDATVFEFYGCWYHGCPTCVANDTVHPFRNLPMSEIYKETKAREAYIE